MSSDSLGKSRESSSNEIKRLEDKVKKLEREIQYLKKDNEEKDDKIMQL